MLRFAAQFQNAMSSESFPGFLLQLKSEDFTYQLPDEAIARFPLEQRDASRLLVREKGIIRHRHFYQLGEELPAGSLLIINDTKVLPARLHFQKSSGAWIELLILEHQPGSEAASMCCKAMIGNKKKWRDGEVLCLTREVSGENLRLEAAWSDREKDEIMLCWKPKNRIFPEILAMWGEMPIPPYLNRAAEASDLENYQTVYAQHPGAVAAPTAGLHFTEAVFRDLEKRGIDTARLTLHVGLGTFRPMKAERVADHDMHPEEVVIPERVVQQLASHSGPLIAVGTTSVRSLESLYWLALICGQTGQFPAELESAQPYHLKDKVLPAKDVFSQLLQWMHENQRQDLRFSTRLYLMPGYKYQVIRGMITNFHQPGSTLMVLVASFLGDGWKEVYQSALNEGYRFLSYGDSSLLLGDD
jgi:S-adenosylmethionine:tRNA ribosyltransferase-isomerase